VSNQEHGSQEPDMPQDRPGWEDRLVDRALQEVHGDRPPDLLAAIERRLLEPAVTRGSAVSEAHAPRRAMRLLPALLMAAALLAVAVGLAVNWTGRAERVPAVQVAMEVVAGRLELLDGGAVAPRVLEPHATQMVLLQRGDRLRSAPRGGEETELVIEPFGMVRMAPQTLMEVKEMDVSLKNGWVAAGSLTFAVVAGAATWHLITQHEHAQAGEVLKLEAPNQSALQGQLQAALGNAQQLQQENQELKQKLATLEQQHRRQTVPVATGAEDQSPEKKPEAAPATASAVTFDDERFRDALAKVDWQVMGGASKELGSLLLQLAAAIEKGEEMPMELAAKIQELNAQLIKQLPALMKAELPGTGPNGVFTHPLVVGNELASMLAQSGLPLSDGERSALEGLVRRYTLENDGIHQQDPEVGLQSVIAELAMKERFYDEVSAQLSPEQRAAMYPDGAGRYGSTSLFRTGIVWATLSKPIDAGNPVDYAKSTSGDIARQIGLDDATAARVQAIVEDVSRQAPAAMWQAGSPIERMRGFERSERAPLAAQTQLAWMQRVMRDVPLSAEQRTKLRQMRSVFVPVPH